MKKLAFFLFGLVATLSLQAQDFRPDTTNRPGRTDAYRIGIIANQPYVLPNTGNTTPVLTHSNLFQPFYTGGDTGAQYFLISTSTLANNNGALFDALHIVASVGAWDGNNREVIDLYLASRTTFYYNWLSRGTHQTTEGIVVYQNANNTFSVYGVLTGNFKFGAVGIEVNNQWKQLPLNLLGTKSASTPSGTLVFDSRNTSSYPPVSTGGGGGTWGSITGTLSSQTDLNTALGNKQDKALTLNAQTGTTYTLLATDCGKMLTFTNASAITVTIPNSTLTAGCPINWTQGGAGQVTFTAGSGVTLKSFQGYVKSGGIESMGLLYMETTSLVRLGGQISN